MDRHAHGLWLACRPRLFGGPRISSWKRELSRSAAAGLGGILVAAMSRPARLLVFDRSYIFSVPPNVRPSTMQPGSKNAPAIPKGPTRARSGLLLEFVGPWACVQKDTRSAISSYALSGHSKPYCRWLVSASSSGHP